MTNLEPNDASYERYVILLTRNEPAVRRFIRTLLPSWGDVDEVMQRTALATWRKFALFDAATDFLKWALVIARFEALAYRRAMGRDRMVFSEDFLAQLADEEVHETEAASREAGALQVCLEKLPPARRELVLAAYADGANQGELAVALGKSPAAFYMLLSRIRSELARCIEGTLREEAAT